MKNWVIAMLLALTPVAAFADECFKNCVTSPEGVKAIQFFEGFSPFRYKDSAGLWTIGYGHLIVPGDRITEPLLGEAATDLLRRDLKRTENGLNSRLTTRLAQHRFDAVSSLGFNIGVTACTGSTLFRYVNAGRHEEVPAQFHRWVNVRVDGKLTPNKGLKVRRAAEAKMYAR